MKFIYPILKDFEDAEGMRFVCRFVHEFDDRSYIETLIFDGGALVLQGPVQSMHAIYVGDRRPWHPDDPEADDIPVDILWDIGLVSDDDLREWEEENGTMA